MAPRQDKQEDSPLLEKEDKYTSLEWSRQGSSFIGDINDAPPTNSSSSSSWRYATIIIVSTLALIGATKFMHYAKVATGNLVATGPYRLVEAHEGQNFFSNYDFYDGPDSLGSTGYNTYVSEAKATKLDIASVVNEKDERTGENEDFVYMSSTPTKDGPRKSVRLEGKTRFNRGLFILDVRHMPDGPAIWPAFWLTDEANWPRNGEVDILEGVNGQTTAKTALHTSDKCDMYAQVAEYAKTGDWEWITGIPDTFTGEPDFNTNKAADNCWVMAPHQWANEGCTAVHDQDDTIGKPVNDYGGGVYALEWDPENHYMKSWVFAPDIPENLEMAIDTAHLEFEQRVIPDPSQWGLPYALFAVGETTGCSADHFKNMRM